MDRSAARAYVYAKASGMLAKSYTGSRASRLFAAKSLRELYGLLFDDEVPAVPETMLAKTIEKKAQERFVAQFTGLLKNYTVPDAVLIALLRFYDYDNLKEIAAALCYKESSMPDIVDIGEYSMLSYRRWPDLAGITAGSPVSWYHTVPRSDEQQMVDQKLDLHYTQSLWQAAKKLPLGERAAVLDLIRREIVYRNVMWVLRLKVYYRYDADAIVPMLAYEHDGAGKTDAFAGDALAVVHAEPDVWDAWRGWKYADFLNPHEDGVVWEIDPAWVERMMDRDLQRRYVRAFHQQPDSALVLFAWFKIKQNELHYIRSVTEGLRLNVETAYVMAAAGVAGASGR